MISVLAKILFYSPNSCYLIPLVSQNFHRLQVIMGKAGYYSNRDHTRDGLPLILNFPEKADSSSKKTVKNKYLQLILYFFSIHNFLISHIIQTKQKNYEKLYKKNVKRKKTEEKHCIKKILIVLLSYCL